MDADQIYKAAMQKWGRSAQVGIAVEEMGELLSALSRHARGRVGVDAIAEEIADVSICIEQLALAFDVQSVVMEMKERKQLRLAQRIAASNGDEQWMRIGNS